MTDRVREWKRVCEVAIGVGTSSERLVVRDLRIDFEVTKTIGHTPNTALIRIRNLAPDSEAKINGEFDEVILKAGYAEAPLLIFAGSIRHTSRYRDGPDYVMEIDAADGDDDLRNTIVNATLAAGTTISQSIDHLVGQFKKTTLGHVIIKDGKRLRGKVMSGSPAKFFEELATQCEANWSIQDGRLEMVGVAATLPNEAVVLRADTGLLGAPERTNTGIKAKCLLNPAIRINGKVKLDNNDLKLRVAKEKEKKPGAVGHTSRSKSKKTLARLDPDGIYKVFKLTHKGDNRGNDWTTEVECKSLATPISASVSRPAEEPSPDEPGEEGLT